jgi:hypothetical protein
MKILILNEKLHPKGFGQVQVYACAGGEVNAAPETAFRSVVYLTLRFKSIINFGAVPQIKFLGI